MHIGAFATSFFASATAPTSSRTTFWATTRPSPTTSCCRPARATYDSCRRTSATGGSLSPTPGVNASVSERLRAVHDHVRNEEIFCANYGDIVSDVALDKAIEEFHGRPDKVASFMTVRQRGPYHVVEQAADGSVTSLQDVSDSGVWIDNGFLHIPQGSLRLHRARRWRPPRRTVPAIAPREKLMSFRHSGFWIPMNTLRDVQELVALENAGKSPWAVSCDPHLAAPMPPSTEPRVMRRPLLGQSRVLARSRSLITVTASGQRIPNATSPTALPARLPAMKLCDIS